MEEWCVLFCFRPIDIPSFFGGYAYVFYMSLPAKYEKQHMWRRAESVRWRDGVYFLI